MNGYAHVVVRGEGGLVVQSLALVGHTVTVMNLPPGAHSLEVSYIGGGDSTESLRTMLTASERKLDAIRDLVREESWDTDG